MLKNNIFNRFKHLFPVTHGSRPQTCSVRNGQRQVDPLAAMFNRQNQTGKGQQAKTGISEAGQRHKQYQAEVGVTGSEFQGRAVRGETQRWQDV